MTPFRLIEFFFFNFEVTFFLPLHSWTTLKASSSKLNKFFKKMWHLNQQYGKLHDHGCGGTQMSHMCILSLTRCHCPCCYIQEREVNEMWWDYRMSLFSILCISSLYLPQVLQRQSSCLGSLMLVQWATHIVFTYNSSLLNATGFSNLRRLSTVWSPAVKSTSCCSTMKICIFLHCVYIGLF